MTAEKAKQLADALVLEVKCSVEHDFGPRVYEFEGDYYVRMTNIFAKQHPDCQRVYDSFGDKTGAEQYANDILKCLGLQDAPLIESPQINILAFWNRIRNAYVDGYSAGASSKEKSL